MENPVLVEVLRGKAIESRHRGSVAVVDADGGIALALGDIDTPVFPRSAVKAFRRYHFSKAARRIDLD